MNVCTKMKTTKHSAPVILRCLSCGAPIRAGQKYHKLHIKGQPYYFCTMCVGLSEFTAEQGEIKNDR